MSNSCIKITAETDGTDTATYKTTYCQFCPFTDGVSYLSLPPKIKCTLTNEYYDCSDTECHAKKKMIPIEWVRQYIEDHTQYMINPQYEGCEFTEPPIDYMVKIYPHQVETMLKKWEKENAADK